MDITPDHMIKLISDVGIPTVMLLGVMYVVYRFSDQFARNYFEHVVNRLDQITRNAQDGVSNAQANRATIERVETKIENQTQVLTEIKTILKNRMDSPGTGKQSSNEG